MCKVLKVYRSLNIPIKKESKRNIENLFLNEQNLNIYNFNKCRYVAPMKN